MEARLFVGDNLSFDPLVLGGEKPYAITGFYSRLANDFFSFEPFPNQPRSLDFRKATDARNSDSLKSATDYEFSLDDFGMSSTVSAENDQQVFLVPRLDSKHKPRLVWHLDLSRPSKNPVVIIRNTARNFWLIPPGNSGMIEADLLDPNFSSFDIGIGGGFLTPTIGQGYAYKLLFRLISANSSNLKIMPRVEEGSLALYFDFEDELRATFYLFPAVDRSRMFVGGTPTASGAISSTVIAVGSPLTPRFMRALSSAAVGLGNFPISESPTMGNPNLTCPMLTFVTDDQVFIPAIGKRHNEFLQSRISELIFVGDIPDSILKTWKNGANLGFIGLITESKSKARNFVGADAKSSSKDGQISLVSSDATVGALVVQNILKSWHGIETFLDSVRDRDANRYSDEIVLGLQEHFGNRLPPLPACLDLEVSAIVQLTNAQRGRVTVDDGNDTVDYLALTKPENWLFRNDNFAFDDREKFKGDLSIRTAVEYMAARAFYDYVSCLEDGLSQVEVEGNTDKDHSLSNFTTVWELGPSSNKLKFREAVAALKSHYSDNSGKKEVLRDIATTMLRRILKRREAKEPNVRFGSWLNPLSVVLAPGPNDSIYDPFLELGVMNWGSFAAGLSASKPAAISVSLKQREDFQSFLRRQARIHRSIRLLPNTTQSLEHYTIKRARAVLGSDIRKLLSDEIFDLLRCLEADRVVYHSPIHLDFVPIHSTILGVEYPLVRYPADDALLDGFVLPSMASVAQNLLVDADNVCVAISKSDNIAETWSSKILELIVQLCPLLGISQSNVLEPNDKIELGSAIEASNLVFLLGHASSEGRGQFTVGHTTVSFEELQGFDWEGKIVFLIGCETASAENGFADLSSTLLRKGAQSVFGTSSRISIEVADVFLNRLLEVAMVGTPLDYAFFIARREAVIFEALAALGRGELESAKAAREVLKASRTEEYFSGIIEKVGLQWEEVFLNSVYSLSLTMTGGVGLRLR